MLKNFEHLIHLSDEVSSAKKNKIPIVALESTIITHGLPAPENYTIALEAENLIRQNLCVPATIAILEGQIKIGLSMDEIKALSQNRDVEKLSTDNLSFSIAQKKTGSTTVAATLVLAAMAKISVFATGGIGGAHRGCETDFDISADLKQLEKTPINVICAGPKAILDIPKTIEILESLGVPLITYQSENIPAFWSQDSGIKSTLVAETVTEISDSFKIRSVLGLQSGQLICNPIPLKDEINIATMEPLIKHSVKLANKKNIKGKDLTPFLLSQVLKNTGGLSLKSNKALLLNNIDLATKIAITLMKN
jgi:pseudouridine-5'-phosphate glycosidase